ncbi:MAG: NAD-dependent epimerase/dehydratase family protein [Parapedobacter sp.]|nr:MAG: NAD-dependent epimerase/dehydratase family protein [Parapedobacter sp.]
MNIVVGATGQIGSYVIDELTKSGSPTRAVVRNPEKLADIRVEFRKADLFDGEQLANALEGGTAVLVLTPENQTSDDIIGDTERIVANYRKAIEQAGITRIVGLSTIGAHIDGKTGNLFMSRILEHGLGDLDATVVFIRPSYYFSNWLVYLDTITQQGILPTFFPEDLPIEMNSPLDVAKCIARAMTEERPPKSKTVIELTGPQPYTSRDVADVFAKLLNKPVVPQSIPREKWHETLIAAGFSENTAINMADMTQAVIDKLTVPEQPGNTLPLPTSLERYLSGQLRK